MKLLFIPFLCFALVLSFNCKKQAGADCGCNSNAVNSHLSPEGGELFYDTNNQRWAIFAMPNRGAAYYYFPCNPAQDSLKAILQGMNQNETFVVIFSGNIKTPCPGENFIDPVTPRSATFNYIVLDSLRRL